MEEVPCVVLKGLTENEKKKYRIIDNKTGELSYWDYELLAVELEAIEGIDMSAFDLSPDEESEENSGRDYDTNLDEGMEIDLLDFDDEAFENECPYCGFRWS